MPTWYEGLPSQREQSRSRPTPGVLGEPGRAQVVASTTDGTDIDLFARYTAPFEDRTHKYYHMQPNRINPPACIAC